MSIVVFNPFSGTNTEYATEELAREAVLELSKQVLENYKIYVAQATIDENGDSTWTPYELTNPIVLS
jgi:hypothetical protein